MNSHIKPNLDRIPKVKERQGISWEQLAKHFGVAYSTFKDIRINIRLKGGALKKGKGRS